MLLCGGGLEQVPSQTSDPRAIATTAMLPSGDRMRICSIRPEDEALLADMVARTTPEDLRLRFFAVTKELSHELAAQLTRIDYTREMALVVQTMDSDEILGVARYSADCDRREAEFALLVRSDWKAHGVGWLLMEKLIAAARKRGIGILSGLVLRENHDMLQFCRNLGFTISSDAANPETLGAVLDLASLPVRVS